MIEDILLGIGFVISATVAVTVVPSLPLPLAFLPLMLATGLIVMHRVGSVPGALWVLVGAGVVEGIGVGSGAIFSALVSAVAGAILVERVFASRSVYALLGLGLSTGAITAVVTLLVALLGQITGAATRSFGSVLGQQCWEVLLLVVALYSGFIIIDATRQALHRFFVIR